MRKSSRHTDGSFKTPLLGMGVLLATTLCFLLLLGILTVLTRLVLG